MKTLSMLGVYFSIALLLPGAASGKSWRGIAPLQSTRADVERILGRSAHSGPISVYRTEEGLVEVRYAVSACRGSVLGWNVPKDTVLEFDIGPSKRENVTIDLSKYFMARGHVARPRYINLEEGLAYELLPNGEVYSISYIPTRADNGLRCPGFPPYNGGLTQYRPFDSFADISISDEQAILDNFAVTLENDPSAKGYIIVYAGRMARVNEAKTYSERAKQYLTGKRKIDKRRLIALDGGHRESLETELYVVPSHMPGPTPTPTIPSNEVQIIKAHKTSNNRHSSRHYKYRGRVRLRQEDY